MSCHCNGSHFSSLGSDFLCLNFTLLWASPKLVAKIDPAAPGLQPVVQYLPLLIIKAKLLSLILASWRFFLIHTPASQPFTRLRKRKYPHWLGWGHVSTLEPITEVGWRMLWWVEPGSHAHPWAQTYLNHVDRGSAGKVFPKGKWNWVNWEKRGVMLRQLLAGLNGSQASRLSLGEA